MHIHEAAALARELMVSHAPTGWSFGFDNARRRFGLCSYRQKLITLSAPLTECNGVDEVRDTILHEIAHALAGPQAGHGYAWRAMARILGARPNRCYQPSEVVMVAGTYQAKCAMCERTHHKYRKIKRTLHCGKCCRRYGFSEKTLLRFERVEVQA
jgi:predicted SprT family Zn-dependent metalloprotease